MTDPARVRVAVDAMGAEGAPCVEVEGALTALTSPPIDVVLVGDQERIREGVTLEGLTVERNNLDDLFLKLTGSTLD